MMVHVYSASGKLLGVLPCKNATMLANIRQSIASGNTRFPKSATVAWA